MFIAATLAASRGATAQDVMFQSPDHQSALLELYTSEGCSSCPPAENWLSRLKTSPRLWREFVPVAFHVDYWDYLGWRDPWGAKEFSNRQRAYAKTWGSETIYTPELRLEWKKNGAIGRRTRMARLRSLEPPACLPSNPPPQTAGTSPSPRRHRRMKIIRSTLRCWHRDCTPTSKLAKIGAAGSITILLRCRWSRRRHWPKPTAFIAEISRFRSRRQTAAQLASRSGLQKRRRFDALLQATGSVV